MEEKIHEIEKELEKVKFEKGFLFNRILSIFTSLCIARRYFLLAKMEGRDDKIEGVLKSLKYIENILIDTINIDFENQYKQ
ncbi:MAG TPA: hypothetical protein ENI33_02785 [Thermoplasmatales archaeon]|nr:hypothetical protein [Thermoplasmatales archaeon]